MKFLRKIRNYICYCGIEKNEYKELKKNAYISNFEIWRILHFLMDAAFLGLFIYSLFSELMGANKWFYLAAFIYSAIATVFFFVLKKDSLIGQLLIYLSISVLFLFAAFLTQNRPEVPAMTFVAFLLIAPLFMIDKPYFMSFELLLASTIFLVWMYFIKDPYIWKLDLVNTVIFTIIGIFAHIIVNSFRIKEFVLIRQINIQNDLDDLTGLKNKGCLTREINRYVQDEANNKALFFVLDIDYFKQINDTFGHDEGDVILEQLGAYLKRKFPNDEIVGRFGGDEFILFFKNIDEAYIADRIAREISSEVSNLILLPDGKTRLSVSMGIAVYHGQAKNYSEIFKKADVALYKTKANRKVKYNIYEE